jgi:hypothetical protein
MMMMIDPDNCRTQGEWGQEWKRCIFGCDGDLVALAIGRYLELPQFVCGIRHGTWWADEKCQ